MSPDAIVAQLPVEIEHKCQVGLDAETGLWKGNHAPLGAVWHCGTCGRYYVRYEGGVRYVGRLSFPALQWLPATRRELRAIRRAHRHPESGDRGENPT